MKSNGTSILGKLFPLFFFLTAWPTLAQETIDLQQAINYALSQNRELVRSSLDVDSSQLDVIRAKSDFRLIVGPDVSLGFSENQRYSSYGLHASKKLSLGTVLSVRTGIQKNVSGPYPYEFKSIQLKIQQPLFRNFGSLIQKEILVQAGNDLKSSRRAFEVQKANRIIEVIEIYESILQLERQLVSDQKSFRRMDKLFRITKAKELLGKTTRVDTLRVELLRGQARLRLETSTEKLASSRRDFAEQLGFNLDKIFSLKPTFLLEFKIPTIGEAVKIAKTNRMDWAQTIQDYEDAGRGVRIARRRLLPDLSLIARKDWTGDGEIFPDTGLRENNWFVGLSLNMDFDLKKELTELAQTKNQQSYIQKTIEIVDLGIQRQVQQQTLVYKRTLAELKIARRNFDLAAARSTLAQRLFQLGRSDNFSVTDAEESYLLAENQLLSAQTRASTAGYGLSYTLGTLIDSPDDLKVGLNEGQK